MAKKTNIEGIDENFIINSFRQDDLTIHRRHALRNHPPATMSRNRSRYSGKNLAAVSPKAGRRITARCF